MDANKLIFRKYTQIKNTDELLYTVQINGHDMEVCPDTGNTFSMIGEVEHAEKLGLTLYDVSHHNEPMHGVDEEGIIKYVAFDVPLVIFGREHHTIFLVDSYLKKRMMYFWAWNC